MNLSEPSSSAHRAIGIFDSGVGGLSIAKCIAQQLPNEQLIYIADTLHAPYGEKSVAFIQQRVNALADFLVQKKVKAIVVACNTATVNAIVQLRQRLTIPIIGVEPAIKPAAKASKQQKVGILVTKATAENPRFQALVEQHKNGSEVFIQPCPGLVELVEKNRIHSTECEQLLRQYLSPLITQKIDKLVLGCTHYPFLGEKISQILGMDIDLVETAAPVTSQLKRMLVFHQQLQIQPYIPKHQFYSSLANSEQQQLINTLWQQPVELKKLPTND
ncbi:glutamate racemase [Thalassotalea sp. PLHSN55]|uniref:glutamate racemase n=1 Tax=Thalassotalea sp. PLHSN55 TaxID=3435888 RepID=UPI003F82B6ED